MDEQERARRKRQLEQHRLRLAILEEEAALEGDVGSTEVGTASEVANESLEIGDNSVIEDAAAPARVEPEATAAAGNVTPPPARNLTSPRVEDVVRGANNDNVQQNENNGPADATVVPGGEGAAAGAGVNNANANNQANANAAVGGARNVQGVGLFDGANAGAAGNQPPYGPVGGFGNLVRPVGANNGPFGGAPAGVGVNRAFHEAQNAFMQQQGVVVAPRQPIFAPNPAHRGGQFGGQQQRNNLPAFNPEEDYPDVALGEMGGLIPLHEGRIELNEEEEASRRLKPWIDNRIQFNLLQDYLTEAKVNDLAERRLIGLPDREFIILLNRSGGEVQLNRSYDCYRIYKAYLAGKLFEFFDGVLNRSTRTVGQSQRGVTQGFIWKSVNGKPISGQQRDFFEGVMTGPIGNLDIRFVRKVFREYSIPEWAQQQDRIALPPI